MPRLTGISPVLLCSDLDRTVAYGFREFGVTDPDGHDIAFGQPLHD